LTARIAQGFAGAVNAPMKLAKGVAAD